MENEKITHRQEVYRFIFVVSLIFNIVLCILLWDTSRFTNTLKNTFSQNIKSYGSANVENWDRMFYLHKEYQHCIEKLRILTIYDLSNNQLDTTLLFDNRMHFSYYNLLKRPSIEYEKIRSNITGETDSIYMEYMNSINYIYCHTKLDSIEIEKSDSYRIFESFTEK